MTDEGKKTTSVAFVGGEGREQMAARYFQSAGYRVLTQGLSVAGASPFTGEAGFVVLPVNGMDEAGGLRLDGGGRLVCDRQWLAAFSGDAVILSGKTPQAFDGWCLEMGIRQHCYLKDAAYQRANAIPTAEAVVRLLMDKREQTIAGADALVLGFGHCGQAIAQRLWALGASVTVAARGSDDRALGELLGLTMIAYDELPQAAGRAQVICNTVPALMLDSQVLAQVVPEAVIIDVASAPGGTDFAAARARGVDCELAGNLPGRFFPQTAGFILAKHLEDIIRKHSLISG